VTFRGGAGKGERPGDLVSGRNGTKERRQKGRLVGSLVGSLIRLKTPNISLPR
jgi:hypothetical protein